VNAREVFEDPLQWLMRCSVQTERVVDESANVHRDVQDDVRSEDLLSRSDIASEML
jgi:hypothetical protein